MGKAFHTLRDEKIDGFLQYGKQMADGAAAQAQILVDGARARNAARQTAPDIDGSQKLELMMELAAADGLSNQGEAAKKMIWDFYVTQLLEAMDKGAVLGERLRRSLQSTRDQERRAAQLCAPLEIASLLGMLALMGCMFFVPWPVQGPCILVSALIAMLILASMATGKE